MITYRNIKTGAILTTECIIEGALWEKISDAPASVEESQEKPEKKTKKVKQDNAT